MVNSESMDSPGDGKAKDCITQLNSVSTDSHSPSPVTASSLCLREMDFANETADITTTECGSPMDSPPETAVTGEEESSRLTTETENVEVSSLYCSVPLNKVQDVLNSYTINLNNQTLESNSSTETKNKKLSRKLLCLYCDRTFVTTNLRQKHVDRCHSERQARRSSSRFQQTQSTTACIFCNKLNNTDHTLKELFMHLVDDHSNKYFACIDCEERFLFKSHLEEHDLEMHVIKNNGYLDISDDNAKDCVLTDEIKPKLNGAIFTHDLFLIESNGSRDKERTKIIKSKHKTKIKTQLQQANETSKHKIIISSNRPNLRMSVRKELRKKKVGVKSTKVGVKRNTRLQAKITQTKPMKKRTKNNGKANEKSIVPKIETNEKSSYCINPYPSFDAFFRVKKITDHSIDNLKISSLTFDDVFDKAFYNRIKCNIQENLQNHIDGKLFKNEESESRISNFEKMREINTSPTENFGCDITLNAATPVVSLLSTQFGEDLESQIEYGSKASKKKLTPKTDEVHYKYFTRRKYQASILESKENRDLSKLDMWTQLRVKNRQQQIINDKKTEKEKLEYAKGDEYRTKMQNEELNRILDRRGPFEDLKEEANKNAAMEKLHRLGGNANCEAISDVSCILNDILDSVFTKDNEPVEEKTVEIADANPLFKLEVDRDCGIPFYLNLRRSSSLVGEPDVDRSDRITLICSSQETENFEEESSAPRDKNALVELTGEWTRSRIYICAACGVKVSNMRLLIDHKSIFHQNVWVQHYEFVGNQNVLYKHLSIPGLGKVGFVEDFPMSKAWKRSDARFCTKCSKTCNSLGELHRHVLECGEDWSWMLARRKLKYRPFGAKSRRKRRGLVKRILHKEKSSDEVREKKKYNIKRIEGPRPKPSDAETIQRMLANLPAKRATRKIISLKDGFPKPRKRQTGKNLKQNRMKSKGSNKLIGANKSKNGLQSMKNSREILKSAGAKKGMKCNPVILRKSVRNINKVFGSKLLDTNSALMVKRKIKTVLQHHHNRITRSKRELEKIEELHENGQLESKSNEKRTFLNKVKTVTKNILKTKKVENVEPNKSKDLNEDEPRVKGASSIRRTRSAQNLVKSDYAEQNLPLCHVALERNAVLCDKNAECIDGRVTDESDENKKHQRDKKCEPKASAKTKRADTPNSNKKEAFENTVATKKGGIGSKLVRSLSLRKFKKTAPEDPRLKTQSNPDLSSHKEEDIEEESGKFKVNNGKRKSSSGSIKKAIKKMKLRRDKTITNIVQVDGSSQISDEIPKILPFLESISLSEDCDKEVVEGNELTAKKHEEICRNEELKETVEKKEGAICAVEEKTIAENATVEKCAEIPSEVVTPIVEASESAVKESLMMSETKEQRVEIKTEDGAAEIVNNNHISSVNANNKIVQTANKYKTKKRIKGLNDCIAMLTSKLQQKFEGKLQEDTSTNAEQGVQSTVENVWINESSDQAVQQEFYCSSAAISKETNEIQAIDLSFKCSSETIEQQNKTTACEKTLFENDGKLCDIINEYSKNMLEINPFMAANHNLAHSFYENVGTCFRNISKLSGLIATEKPNLRHEEEELKKTTITNHFKTEVDQVDGQLANFVSNMEKFGDMNIVNKFKEVDVNIEIDIMKCLEKVAENNVNHTRAKLKKTQNQRHDSARKFNNKRKENIDEVTNVGEVDHHVRESIESVISQNQNGNDQLNAAFIKPVCVGLMDFENEALAVTLKPKRKVGCRTKIAVSHEAKTFCKRKTENSLVTEINQIDSSSEQVNPQDFSKTNLQVEEEVITSSVTVKIDKFHKNKDDKILVSEDIKSLFVEQQQPDLMENKPLSTHNCDEETNPAGLCDTNSTTVDNIIAISPVLALSELPAEQNLKKADTDSEDELPLASLIKGTEVVSSVNDNAGKCEESLVQEAVVSVNNIEEQSKTCTKTGEKKRKSPLQKKVKTGKNKLKSQEDGEDVDLENGTRIERKLKISTAIFQNKHKNLLFLGRAKKVKGGNAVKPTRVKVRKNYGKVALMDKVKIKDLEEIKKKDPQLMSSEAAGKIEVKANGEITVNTEKNVNDIIYERNVEIEKIATVNELQTEEMSVEELEMKIRRSIMLSNEKLRMESGELLMKSDRPQIENGQSQVENGSLHVESGKHPQIENGQLQLERSQVQVESERLQIENGQAHVEADRKTKARGGVVLLNEQRKIKKCKKKQQDKVGKIKRKDLKLVETVRLLKIKKKTVLLGSEVSENVCPETDEVYLGNERVAIRKLKKKLKNREKENIENGNIPNGSGKLEDELDEIQIMRSFEEQKAEFATGNKAVVAPETIKLKTKILEKSGEELFREPEMEEKQSDTVVNKIRIQEDLRDTNCAQSESEEQLKINVFDSEDSKTENKEHCLVPPDLKKIELILSEMTENDEERRNGGVFDENCSQFKNGDEDQPAKIPNEDSEFSKNDEDGKRSSDNEIPSLIVESRDTEFITVTLGRVAKVKAPKKRARKSKSKAALKNNEAVDANCASGTVTDDSQFSNLKMTIDVCQINNNTEVSQNRTRAGSKKTVEPLNTMCADSSTPELATEDDAVLEKMSEAVTNKITNLDNGHECINITTGEFDLSVSNSRATDLSVSSSRLTDLSVFSSRSTEAFHCETHNNEPKGSESSFSNPIPVLNKPKVTKKSKKGRRLKNAHVINENDTARIGEQIDSDVYNFEDDRNKTLGMQQQNDAIAQTPDLNDASKLKVQFKVKANKKSKKNSRHEVNGSPEDLYCDICDKMFVRNENLVKHKRTLTHIAKLSELEAKEAAEKTRAACNEVMESVDAYKMNINISDILNNTEKDVECDLNNEVANNLHVTSPFMLNTNSDTLKLADIINDVLNKPVGNDGIKHNSYNEPSMPMTISSSIAKEPKRYKSLGERKSFESDLNSAYSFNNLQMPDDMTLPKLPNNTDAILKHQISISILENIIENQGPFDYIDDITVSSNKSVERLSRNSPSELSVMSDSKQYDSNQITFAHNTNIMNSLIKPGLHNDNFVKPTQYEEISNDSSTVRNHFDDQRSRKVLNRDEELFLECCSLLKSSSEVSSYSKRSPKNISMLNNFEMKAADEPDWLERKSFSAKNQEFRDDAFSDSCPNTPLGDGFGDEYSNSNSNTIATDWNSKQKGQQIIGENPVFEDISLDTKESPSCNENSEARDGSAFKTNHFNDFRIFGTDTDKYAVTEENQCTNKEDNDCIETACNENVAEVDNDLKKKMVSRFGGLMAKAFKNSLQVVKKTKIHKKKQCAENTQTSITDYVVPLNPSSKTESELNDNKKMLTKGAMKVFEGLKVSIPTDDLDIKELLNGTFGAKKIAQVVDETPTLETTTDQVEFPPAPEPKENVKQVKKTNLKKFGNKLGLKVTKKKHVAKLKNSPVSKNKKFEDESKKAHDVYDFEETQDNTDIFSKTNFTDLTTFRNQIIERKSAIELAVTVNKDCEVGETEINAESDSESNNKFLDSFSFEAQSVSSLSTESTTSVKKPKQKNITKKKCMIMGRIFKNAFKSKVEDDIRDIPIVDNSKLVEDYVMQLPEDSDSIKKPNKMSEHEMDILFDKLLQDKNESDVLPNKPGTESKPSETKQKLDAKTAVKTKPKTVPKRKRQRQNSDFTDDEFNIGKTKKRSSKKKLKNTDDGINLEQELKECIGVASRKSQRKCTSGKQNVLVEFWSSDDSNFETLFCDDPPASKAQESTPFIDESPTVIQEVESSKLVTDVECVITIEDSIEIQSEIISSVETEKQKTFKTEKTANIKQVRRKSNAKPNRNKDDEDKEDKNLRKIKVTAETLAANRRKRAAADTLYYWSSSSEDESQDLIEVKPIRDELDEDDERPMHHGWIVGDSPKKLVTMLAQAKGKKVDADGVKEQGKKRTTV